MKSFSINEALSAGWTAFTGRAGFFIGLLLLLGVLSIIPQIVIKSVEAVWLAIVLGIVFQLFQYFLTVGMLRISLMVVDGGQASIGDLFSGAPSFAPYVLGTLLYSLIVAAGLVLLVVPGIIAMVMFGYYGYLIIDSGLGPVDALKASAALTQGARWKLLGFGFVLTVLNLLGAVPFGLGLFATVPVSLVAMAFVYRRLSSQTAVA
jgi:uncharacterized membrane protein